EAAHLGRGQIITFDAEGLRIFLQRAHGQLQVVRVRELIVGIDKSDIVATGVIEGETFAFLHVLAGIIQDVGAVFFGNVTRVVRAKGVGEDDFAAITRIRVVRKRSPTIHAQTGS